MGPCLLAKSPAAQERGSEREQLLVELYGEGGTEYRAVLICTSMHKNNIHIPNKFKLERYGIGIYAQRKSGVEAVCCSG